MSDAVAIEVFEPVHAAGVSGLIVPIQQDEFGIDIDAARQPDCVRSRASTVL